MSGAENPNYDFTFTPYIMKLQHVGHMSPLPVSISNENPSFQINCFIHSPTKYNFFDIWIMEKELHGIQNHLTLKYLVTNDFRIFSALSMVGVVHCTGLWLRTLFVQKVIQQWHPHSCGVDDLRNQCVECVIKVQCNTARTLIIIVLFTQQKQSNI